MPRSYSFDHFQVPKREPNERSGSPDIVKAAVKKQKGGSKLKEELPQEAASGLHYGQGHSETIERYQSARKKARARPQKKQKPAARAESPRPAQAAAKKQAAPKQVAPKETAEAPARPTRTRVTPAKPLVGPLLVAGVKVVARAAAAAKRTVKAVAKKAPSRKSSKKR